MNGRSPDDVLPVITIRSLRSRTLTASQTRAHVLVEIRPDEVPSEPVRSDIRLIVDVSGSMAIASGQSTRLEVVKQAILNLVSRLDDRDSVLLSVFSDDGRLVVPLGSLTADGSRQRIREAVLDLQPKGATNISSGLELGLDPPVAPGALPRVILFTDGKSSHTWTDQTRLEQLAELARARGLPLSIYGTGSGYSWKQLRQIAWRAGAGSFLKHVMDVATLEGHMLAELECLRGTTVDRLEIGGLVAHYGIRIVSVTALIPTIRELDHDEWAFLDRPGALDAHRGAKYLIELENRNPRAGKINLLNLDIHGRHCATKSQFRMQVPVNLMDETPVDEEVSRVLLMIRAAKNAEEGKYEEASNLFQRAGDEETSIRMHSLHTASMRPGADSIDLEREATTLATGSVSSASIIWH